MRGADFPSSACLDQLLEPVDLSQARRSLIEDALPSGASVGVPANASRALVDAIKATGRRPIFCPLDAWGGPEVSGQRAASIDAVVVQAVAGNAPPYTSIEVDSILIDATDTVLVGTDARVVSRPPGSLRPASSARAQTEVVTDIRFGLEHAAGLALMPANEVPVLPCGAIVQLPEQAEVTTFVAYARAELTGIEWLALRRPLHHQARHHLSATEFQRSARHLERLVHVPAGPDFTAEEIDHGVLGIVKAAEYTGWRWSRDRAQAAWYADWLVAKYGPDHEAYRSAFEI